jgi:hypothetical protein
VFKTLVRFKIFVLLYSRVGAGAGAASNFYPEPESHENDAAPQHWQARHVVCFLGTNFCYFFFIYLYNTVETNAGDGVLGAVSPFGSGFKKKT